MATLSLKPGVGGHPGRSKQSSKSNPYPGQTKAPWPAGCFQEDPHVRFRTLQPALDGGGHPASRDLQLTLRLQPKAKAKAGVPGEGRAGMNQFEGKPGQPPWDDGDSDSEMTLRGHGRTVGPLMRRGWVRPV